MEIVDNKKVIISPFHRCNMIKAVLMDLDNTLVLAADWHYVALNKALKEVSGTEINEVEHKETFNGLPTKKKLERLIEAGRVKAEDYKAIWQKKQEYTLETINESAKPDPVKIKLHRQNKWNGLKLGCVTNSITETAMAMLENTGQLEYMDLLVSNEVIKHPKPHAEGYIVAMVKLGVYPAECILVEDSHHGVAAARATGAYVWEVTGPADVTWENFQQFMIDINSGRITR